jgi:hypothetical protein
MEIRNLKGGYLTPEVDAILHIANGARRAQILATAFDIKVFDYLKDKESQTVEQLTEHFGLKIAYPRDFWDSLYILGVLLRDDEGKYSNSPVANEYCISTELRYIGAWCQRLGTIKNHPMVDFTDKIKMDTFDPQFSNYANSYESDEELMYKFSSWMNGLSAVPRENVCKLHVWKKATTFAEVAGNNGYVASKICLDNPHLKGVVLDLPKIENAFNKLMTTYNLQLNLGF